MPKQGLWIMLLLPMGVLANDDLNASQFIGKWQCDIKHHQTIIGHHQLHFLRNGVMNEHIRIESGQKGDYHHQIEQATASTKWHIKNNQLYYANHQFNHYSVRMPNAHKHDTQQANIALQKSLPMIKDMMSDEIHERVFDVSFINTRSFIMNDVNHQRLMTCHKKGLFNF